VSHFFLQLPFFCLDVIDQVWDVYHGGLLQISFVQVPHLDALEFLLGALI